MKNKVIRDSNFELLRIIAIIIIMICHVNSYIVKYEIGNAGTEELFNIPLFFNKAYLISLPTTFRVIGDTLFILISGYFLCERSNINILKTIKKLLGQLLFASIVLLIFSFLYQNIIDNKAYNLTTIFTFNDCWWFIGYYIAIILIGYFFINKYLNRLNKNQYEVFLLLLFSLFSLSFPRTIFSGLSEELDRLLVGVFIYALGGYFKKYNFLDNIKNSYLIMTIILCISIQLLSYKNFAISNINDFLITGKQYMLSFHPYYVWSLTPNVLAIALFALFKRIRFKSVIINYISESVFMIYLMHENDLIWYILRKYNYALILYNSYTKYMFVLMITCIILFVFGFIMYQVYKGLSILINKKNIGGYYETR